VKKLLVIQVAALSHELLREHGTLHWQGLEFHPAQSVFPAVTCTAQASFRTAAPPSSHGMIANGLFHRELNRPFFWEQSARLVAGRRIWEDFRARGGRVGLMFWQQSLGEAADLLLSPAPIHRHHGGMIQDCYAQPPELYGRLCQTLGREFKLRQYWGPLASAKVGDWIADATAAVLADQRTAPHLLLTYLPSLDYDLQRFGTKDDKSCRAIQQALGQIARMLEAARQEEYDLLIFGDYAMAEVSDAVFPNRALRQAGLMSVREINGMLYPDFHASRAFAVVDHEIAHVYIKEPSDIRATRAAMEKLPGIGQVLDGQAQRAVGLNHDNSGELVLVAEEGKWFAYPWWTSKRQRPDYATHMDIHNKPGYDPCELYFGWPPPSVSQNVSRIRGSHGRTDPGREIAWASTLPIGQAPTLIDLAAAVRQWLDEAS
jgi:predicted AlkP superfamily pyrophosphatase or phosphodiesterase